MRPIIISLTLSTIVVSAMATITLTQINIQKPNQKRSYFLAKSYWKKGYPFLIPFPFGTSLEKVAYAFFSEFKKIFLKTDKTWKQVSFQKRIYEDITFKIEK